MPGPAPTPTAILKMHGSRLVRSRDGEVAFSRKKPACPKWLPKDAKAEWNRYVKELDAAGVLQIVDGALLASLCWTIAEQSRLVAKLTKRPNAKDAWRTSVQIDRCQKRLMQLAAQFGFSPASRTRVKASDLSDGTDPFEKFLSGAS